MIVEILDTAEVVAAGFSLRYSTSDGRIWFLHKLRNLKDATTSPNVLFSIGGHK